MIEEAGFIPPFFPESVPVASPINKGAYLKEVNSTLLFESFLIST